MQFIIQVIGTLTQVLGTLTLFAIICYFSMSFIKDLLKVDKKDTGVKSNLSMPVLKPLIIPTKNQSNFIYKIMVFLTTARRWQVAEDWTYIVDEDLTLFIPAGFIFDGASIPRCFWTILSPTGLLLIPGLIHDYGYRYDQIWKLDENGSPVEYKKNAGKDYWDNLFKDVGDNVNNMLFVNLIAKLGVKFGGAKAWGENRQLNEDIWEPASADVN